MSYKPSTEKYYWLLFLVTPAIGFIIAILNFNKKPLRKFIVLFGLFYAFVFIPIPGSDATRIISSYEAYDLSDYFTDITSIYNDRGKKPDLYIYTVYSLSKVFDLSPRGFRVLLGLIYFSFLVKLIGQLYDLSRSRMSNVAKLFLLGGIFVISISAGLNGVRWPLAFVVFLYGSLKYNVKTKFKYFLLAGLSIFIHFSFLPAVIVFGLLVFIPALKNVRIMYVLLLLAFFGGQFVSNYVFSSATEIGGVYESKLGNYTSDGYLEKRASRQASWNFYVPIVRYGNYYFSIFSLFMLSLYRKKINIDPTAQRLVIFSLITLIFSFLAGGVLDIATNRYIHIVSFSTLASLFYLTGQNKGISLFRNLALIYFPVAFITIFSLLRVDIQTVDISIFSNFFIEFILGSNNA
ncbi:EpsG family protein [Lewinella sp. LCG006]|uniref:EpsG family protein n=1 Tax=Lewinella sp. LCG006 TaxID=3231911 RepID=UPI00345FFB96